VWYFDSGCARHMTGNPKLLTDVIPHKGAKIVFGDNAYGNTVGKGKLIHGNISIVDVLVFDNLKYNLISISQLCDKGYIVKFQQHTCTVQSPSGLTVLVGKRSGNTYIIDRSDQQEPEQLCLAAGSSKSWLWHQRMNHLHFKTIAKLSQHDLVSGLPKISFSKDKICAACQLGKQIKSTFKNKGGKRSSRCLELLHMDLFGPISVTSLGGMSYTLAVVDDFSKYTWVLLLKAKSETADQLIKLLKRLQNDKSCSVNRIRSDRGTEFLNFKLTSYLEDLGIKHELSAARTPQQNGLAETALLKRLLELIPADHKGKEPLIEKNPIKGNPVMEQVTLILADIDCLVQVRAKLVDEVAKFFYSFSFKRLANLSIDDSYFDKEELVLTWAEAESTGIELQRRRYILLNYREVLLRKFLEVRKMNFKPSDGSSAIDLKILDQLYDIHLFILEELKKEIQAHGLMWKKTCCSKIFEGRPRDRGAVIARTNSNTPSKCWIRTMLRVNGTWVIESCADYWMKIPQPDVHYEISRQRQYDDTLPSVSKFFRMMRKRWADVCLEVAEFCAYRILLPVGSINFCRALEIVEPDSRVDYRQPTVFALRLSQFCTVHIQYSLFSRLTTEDITDFLSSIALERTVLRSVQNSIVSADVPHVQLSLVQDQSSSSSADSSSSLNFDATDLDAPVSSLPTVSIDFYAALADFQAILLAQIDESQSGISSRLHKIEQSLCDSLRDQADIFKILSQGARQEARTIDDVQTLRFNEFRKNVLAQNASIFTGLADV
ncbi:retrovirus-related Pol polyprotein from transposon TNT 1-94, partial [Dorcoceras hygrometricum]